MTKQNRKKQNKLYKNEIGLGDTDSEWVIFNTCRFMNTSTEAADGVNTGGQVPIISELESMHKNGLHISMGWKTRMQQNIQYSLAGTSVNENIGRFFVEQLRTGMNFIDAWQATCENDAFARKTAGAIGRSFYADLCKDDNIKPVNNSKLAPIVVSRDPVPSESYSEKTYREMLPSSTP